MTFKHHIKIFFPEIRNGFVFVDKAKYSVDAGENDEISLSHKIHNDGRYEEYVTIKDFVAEFTVEVAASIKNSGSVSDPFEIYCDFIDIYVHNQKISLTVHDNNFLVVPYFMSYRSDFPPELARQETKSLNLALNAGLDYGFILGESAKDKLEEKGFKGSKIDPIMLDTKRLYDAKKKDVALTGEFRENRSAASALIENIGTGDKYGVLLPEAIFPDKMTLAGLPIFDSEIIMRCCDIVKAGFCTPYLPRYGVNTPAACAPMPCENPKCQDEPQYEVRNKVIDGYILLTDNDFDVLDRMAGIMQADVNERNRNAQNIQIEDE